MNYLLLVAGVTCALIALICMVSFVAISVSSNEEETELQAKWRRRIIAGTSVGFIVTAYGAWRIYSYLFVTDPLVLRDFGVWYAIGYVSRFLMLMKRHSVLDPRFSTEWHEVFAALLWALYGPLVAVLLIRMLVREKDPFTDKR